MKNKILSLIAIVLIGLPAIAQNRQTRSVDTFTKIAFRSSGTLYLKQGSPQKVEIEASEETLSKLLTEVDDGKLSVGFDKKWNSGWKNPGQIKVYITVKDIDAISVSGSGDLIAQTKLTGDDFKITVSGSGSLDAEVSASGDIDANISGSGNMHLKGSMKSFESDISGSGDLEIVGNISNDASFELSGSGKVTASGSAQRVKASISGSGEVRAADLQADSCDVRISGSGDVQISVKSSIDASISGSGTVSYRGNPSHVNSHASGSGHVRKM